MKDKAKHLKKSPTAEDHFHGILEACFFEHRFTCTHEGVRVATKMLASAFTAVSIWSSTDAEDKTKVEELLSELRKEIYKSCEDHRSFLLEHGE